MAVQFTPAAPTYDVVKGELRWNADGTRTVVLYYMVGANVMRREEFLINNAVVKDRFGVTLITPNASFFTNLTTLETAIDNAITSLQQNNKLNPP